MIATLLAFQDTVVEALPPETAAAAAQATAETVHSGINYIDLMLKASLPVKLIVLLLLAGSLISWIIIFRKARVFKTANRDADEFEGRFWSGAELHKLYAGAADRNRVVTGLEAIFEAGFREFTRLRDKRGLDGRAQLEGAQRAMRVTYTREVDQLERNLELLANIGSTAPYVGLVGTVFGIMVTMHDMLNSGEQAGIAAVAPGISEALFATAIGLFVAIPAVWAYNRFTTRVERLSVRYESFAEEFSSILQRQSSGEQAELPMAGSIFHRKRRKLKSEINVVPYIDVMLVLLIIFMVTAPLLTLSVDVKLPSSSAKAVETRNEPIIVIAYPDGRFGLKLPEAKQPEVLDAAGLEAKVAAIRGEQGNELRIMVAAEGSAPYQKVLDAMDVLRRAKVSNVSLMTNAGGNAR